MLRKVFIIGALALAIAALGTTGIVKLLEEGRAKLDAAASRLPGVAAAPTPHDQGVSTAKSQPKPDTNKTAPKPSTKPGSNPVPAALDRLPVKGRAAMTGYSREQFGSAWTDNNDDLWGHNHCTTRDDVLRRDLHDVKREKTSTCADAVASGVLDEPYTGAKGVQFTRGSGCTKPDYCSSNLQIDHVAALGDVWVTGGQKLSAQQRVDLANDPLELLAVDGPANEQKGDSDAASWLPKNKRFRCTYVSIQVAVKTKYHLWVTSAEKTAIANVLSSCPGQRMPIEPGGQ